MPAFAGLELTAAAHGCSSEQPRVRKIQPFPNQRVEYPDTGAVGIKGQLGFKNNNKKTRGGWFIFSLRFSLKTYSLWISMLIKQTLV